jgi:glycosyltransferase involved in cell wall biosynthesis
MIFFDTTKTGDTGHRSGLNRVSERLRAELGAAATAVRWGEWDQAAGPDDWFLTGELFSAAERPGFADFLAARRCRAAAIFHDAIPLRFPHITWPRSVARHPAYLKLLAGFDRVWAVSAASRTDLRGFWHWQGLTVLPSVDLLALGADFRAGSRVLAGPPPVPARPALLCVGILEPRKNQALLLQAFAELWREGVRFDLHFVGRVNPHFGAPILGRLKRLRREFSALHYHDAASDETLAGLYAGARASVFPTLAEGCGLPLLESLWQGVPCVCSDLPVLRENADGGGCLPVKTGDLAAWKSALKLILTDDLLHDRLRAEARTRPLPTWADAAQALRAGLGPTAA